MIWAVTIFDIHKMRTLDVEYIRLKVIDLNTKTIQHAVDKILDG